jgi:uncharacterized protein YcfJ
MKHAMLTVAMAAVATTGFAGTDLIDTAQVISSTPVVERVSEPRQECSTAPAAAPAPAQNRNLTGAILGSVAGGLLGAQVGKGSGRTAAAATGAAVGAILGDRVSNPDSERPVSGAVLGGAAGGLLGAQVGRGSGQVAAAATGAAVGAVAGDSVQNSGRAAAPAQTCRTVQVTREVTKGYTVVYRYNDRDITTTLPYQPGSTVQVGVGIVDSTPAASAPSSAPMGSNVRDVTSAASTDIAPVSANHGYRYRY